MRALVVSLLLVGCTSGPERVEVEPLVPAPVRAGGIWDPRFAVPGVSHDVTGDIASVATIVPRRDGRIVAVGSFERAGELSVDGIAQWDGSHWEALPGVDHRASVVEDAGGVLWASSSGELTRLIEGAWTPVGTTHAGAGLVALGEGVAAFGRGIELWTARSHETLATPYESVRAIVPTPTGFCAATQGGVICWDGATWRSLGGPIDLRDLVRTTDGTWWGRVDIGAAGPIVRLAPDGTWEPMPALQADESSVWIEAFRASGTDVLVGGRLQHLGNGKVCMVARLRAGAWHCEASTFAMRSYIAVSPRVTSLIPDGKRIHVGGWFSGTDALVANVATIEADGRLTPWGASSPTSIAGGIWSARSLPGRLLVEGHPQLPGVGRVDAAVFDGTRWREATADEATVRVETLDGTRYSLVDYTTAYKDGDVLDARGASVVDLAVHDGSLIGLLRFERTVGEDTVADYEIAVLRDGRFEHLAPAPPAYELASSPAVGLVALGDWTLDAWDGASWQPLVVPDTDRHYEVGACADGIYVASFLVGDDEGTGQPTSLRFFDGVTWTDLADLGRSRVPALTPTSEGLLVASGFSGSPLHLLRPHEGLPR